jgi:predicted metal-dependent hydrolase
MKKKVEELKEISIGNDHVSYLLRPSQRARHLRLAIYCDASVVVTMPYGANLKLVEKFLREKAGWIIAKVLHYQSRPKRTILISGKRNYRKFKTESLELARSRVEYFNNIYKFQVNRITVKDQKTRWGSCSKKRNLNFNYKLLFLPAELSDYLIVHELCHLKEFNHSKAFWGLVAVTIPDFKILRRKLKNYSV